MKKVYLLMIMLGISTLCNAGGDYSAQIQSLKVEINRLTQEKETKTKQLELCRDKLKGLKVGGITTLGLTGVGIGANIGEAVVISSQNKEKDNLAMQLKEKVPLSSSIGNVDCDEDEESNDDEETIIQRYGFNNATCEYIFFNVNKSSIDENGLVNITDAITQLNNICKQNPTHILILGHCSTTASSKYNQKLSYDRANNTYEYLKNIQNCNEGNGQSRVVYTKYYLGESGGMLPFSTPPSTNIPEQEVENEDYRYAMICYLTSGNI